VLNLDRISIKAAAQNTAATGRARAGRCGLTADFPAPPFRGVPSSKVVISVKGTPSTPSMKVLATFRNIMPQ
jgi:hypothetical protein